MPLFSQVVEPLELRRVSEYLDLSTEQRERAEAVYAVYRNAVGGKRWRVANGEEVAGFELDQSIEEMYSKEKKDTVNGWVHYALNVPLGDPGGVDEAKAKELFEKHY